MSQESEQQQTSDATNPDEKIYGQFWGIDLFLVHDSRILPCFGFSLESASTWPGMTSFTRNRAPTSDRFAEPEGADKWHLQTL
jgi:hypothetical protein